MPRYMAHHGRFRWDSGTQPVFAELRDLFARYKGPLDRVLDIGAHLGTLEYLVLKANPDAQIVAVEPWITDRLEAQLRDNGVYDQVTVVGMAVARGSGSRLEMRQTGFTTGVCSALYETPFWTNEKPQVVSTISIKDLLKEFGEFDLVKMDIEGAEFSVLGEPEVKALASSCTHFLVEVHEGVRIRDGYLSSWFRQHGVTWQAMVNLLEQHFDKVEKWDTEGCGHLMATSSAGQSSSST